MKLDRWPFWRMDAAAVAIALAGVAAVYTLAIRPAQRAAAEQRAKLDALAPSEALRDQLTLSLEQTRERLALARAELDASPLRLEPVSRINQRLQRITDLAADAGLNLDQLTPGEQVVADDAVVMAIRITGRASFPAATMFLGRLHADFADMAVTGFRLSGNIEAAGAPGVFEFDLAWYAAPDEAPPDREASVPLP